MENHTAEDIQVVLQPIVSLIRKSEKAQQKCVSGTWQHTMLRDNIKALHTALSVINKVTNGAGYWSKEGLLEDLKAIASMIEKTEQAQTGFTHGTAQYTLLHNRLEALRVAEARIQAELDKR